MKKYFFIPLFALLFFSCEQHDGSNNGTASETDKNSASSEALTAKQAAPAEKMGIVVTQNDTADGNTLMVNIEDNKTVKAVYNKAVQYFDQGKLKEAAQQFDIVLQSYPENSGVLNYMGRIYFSLNNLDLSLKYYEKALASNSGDSLSTLAIGMIYYQKKNLEKAMEYYSMAVEGFPNYGLAYYNRGTLYGQQKKYSLSLADLNKAIELDKTNPNAYLNRGLDYFYLKQMENACNDWNKASEMGLAEGKKAVETYCKK